MNPCNYNEYDKTISVSLFYISQQRKLFLYIFDSCSYCLKRTVVNCVYRTQKHRAPRRLYLSISFMILEFLKPLKGHAFCMLC